MLAKGTATEERLAGLDGRDIASDAHPYLHLAGIEDLLARRRRTAQYTPGGLRQPPELAGVDADARVPNPLQPMNGEMTRAGEVGEGRAGFFGRLMPPPTGVANGVGVGDAIAGVRPFGAPMKMNLPDIGAVGADRLTPGAHSAAELAGSGRRDAALSAPAGLLTQRRLRRSFAPPPLTPQSWPLPRFQSGGELPAGGTGVVGENGPETITALPGGGARIVPTGLPRGFGMLQARGSGQALPPPGENAWQMAYEAAMQRVAGRQPPNPSDPQYRTSGWRRALAIGAGALESGLTRNPQYGAQVAGGWAPDKFGEAYGAFQRQQQQDLSAIQALLNAARLARGRSPAATQASQSGQQSPAIVKPPTTAAHRRQYRSR